MQVTGPVASAFTYSLGKSLYIPLTSRCNACTLPETRGPNFLLPADVVSALCRVRDEENETEQWKHWCMYLDTQEGPQKLPKAQETVASLGENKYKYPSAETLAEEIQQQIDTGKYEAVVFAGEGEPTLRLGALVKIAETVSSGRSIPLRLTTNGLVQSSETASLLQSSGISSVSVALMTQDPAQYKEIMRPKMIFDRVDPHDVVCQFIRTSLQTGLTVEVTGVARPDVDQGKTEALAKSLGVTEPFRWRSYFP